MSIEDQVDDLFKKSIPQENINSDFAFDTIQEQIEAPMTTIYCPESIKEDQLRLIDRQPENYIEINFIKKIRVVDNFFIPSNLKTFHYRDKEYSIVEENIYILPTKKGYFIPTCFFSEGVSESITFKQENKGISAKALSLLYDISLYVDLFSSEEGQYNIFIVIFLLGSIVSYLVGLYFILGGTV